MWMGQCAKSPYGMYNCFYNGPAVEFYNNTELLDLINSTCPHYINKSDPKSSKVCCDVAQVTTLKTQVKAAIALFSRCPVCIQNFILHFCLATCDPDMSLWLNPPDGSIVNITNSTKQYLKSMDLYVTMNYANTVYDSCKNVQYPETTNKVIDLMCGGVPKCNATDWITFLGSPTLNHGAAPFLLDYKYGDTVPSPDMIPQNTTFTNCNITNSSLTCSCADCPAPNTCPPLPAIESSHFHYVVVASIIVAVGAAISIAICTLALLGALFHRHKRAGYTPISTESEPSLNYGATGDTGTRKEDEDKDSPTSSVGSINDDDHGDGNDLKGNDCQCCECYHTIGHFVENEIKHTFYLWGRFCAQYWYLVLLGVILIAAALSCGVFFLKITTDPVKLWSAPDSRARVEKDYFDDHFGPFYRTEQLIITAPGRSGYSFLPHGVPNARWTFGPVFNMDILEEVGWS